MIRVILKIGFEKAYDKVKLSFLQQTLRMKGFSEEWRALINNLVCAGGVAIKVNNDIGRYFQTKSLRKDDPLSLMLFTIVADMLVIIIEHAKNDSQIAGVVPHLVDGGLSVLQYVDDMILFTEHGLQKERNLKLILLASEQILTLRINFHKNELFCFDIYAELFGRGIGKFPITYLGVLIHYQRLTNIEWKNIEERL
jgi:hypothetical protein